MCFLISKKFPKVLKAKKDIKVWKVLRKGDRGCLHGYFQSDFEYKLNKLYKSELKTKSPRLKMDGTFYYQDCFINKGLHSYNPRSVTAKRNVAEHVACVNFGFGFGHLFSATIPKGSLYWYNPSEGEYVSNQLIITKEL